MWVRLGTSSCKCPCVIGIQSLGEKGNGWKGWGLKASFMA